MDERPSIWGIGLSAGLFTAGVLLLVALLQRLPFELAWLAIGPSVVVACWFGLPVLVWLVITGWSVFQTLYAWRHRNDKPAAPPAPPPAAPAHIVIRQIPLTDRGRERPPVEMATVKSARWSAWQRGAERWLDWYKQLSATTSGAMVGKFRAFKDNTAWQTFTDELDRVACVDKKNGRRAILAAPLPEVEARIRSGEIEWREDVDPPAVAEAPHPATSVPVTIEGSLA